MYLVMMVALKPSRPGAFLVLNDEMTDESSNVVKGGSSLESGTVDCERLRSDWCESVSVEGSSSGKYCDKR